MKDKLTLLLMGLLCAFFSSAQEVTGQLKGDSGSIQYANVVLFNYGDSSVIISVASAEDGSFSLKINEKDSVFIESFYTGFKSFSSKPFVGAKQFGEIRLEGDTKLDTLTITFKKPFQEISAHGTTFNVNGNAILQNGSADRLLRKLPGVQIRQGRNIAVNGKNNATVYINGKRSYLEEKDLIQYLQTIPADQILKVEVYDTPPARFDADGNGAIINIIIKKPPLGTNGRLSSEFGYGNLFKMGTIFFVNHRTKKFNVYGGIQFRLRQNNSKSSDSTILNQGKGHYMFNDGESIEERNKYDAKIGIDYYPNEKTTFGIYYDYGSRVGINKHITEVNIAADIINDYNAFNGKEATDHESARQNFNFDFNHAINDSVNISSDFVFLRLDFKDDINTRNDLFQEANLFGHTLTTSKSNTNINIMALKGDYRTQLKNKWHVDAGIKYSYIFNDNNFISYSGTNETDLVLNLNVSNDFKYFESIAAGYISIQKTWSKSWSTDIGGRAEQTNVKGASPTESLKFTNNYFNFFPNTSVMYKPSKKHQFSLLYTERIDRPNTTELNPFLKAVNELEFKSGNPDLKPAIDKLINFKYILLEHINLSIETGRKYDYYAEIVDQDISTGLKTWKPSNIGKAEYVNVNLGTPIPIIEEWMAYVNLNYLFAQLNAEPNHYKVNNFSAYIGNEIELPNAWSIGLSGWYSHGSFWNIWKVDPSYSASCSITKKIGKWGFGLEVYDFLNTEYYTSRAQYNDLDVYTTFKGESRSFWLDITYRFGNNKIKESRERNIGEDENERVE